MLRIMLRTVKSVLTLKGLLFCIGAFAITIFVRLVLFDSLCPIIRNTEFRSLDRRQTGNVLLENINPDELEEIKKLWILEYEEQRIRNEKIKNEGGAGLPESSDKFEPIECSINNDYNVNCIRLSGSDEDIYMPFKFIEKYFEVYGKLRRYDAIDRFEFSQSYAQLVYDSSLKYSFNGIFMTFDTYNVESRERVKCITGKEGVPISTQWGAQGYFYPIQISQFSLSHYSKNIREKTPHKTVYEDAEKSVQRKRGQSFKSQLSNLHDDPNSAYYMANRVLGYDWAGWKSENRHCTVENVPDPENEFNRVIRFSTPDYPGNSVSLSLGNTMEYSLSFDVVFKLNGSITVVLETVQDRKEKLYSIHYYTSGKMIDYDKHTNVFYNIGPRTTWSHIARNLVTDLSKGLGMTNGKAVKKVKVNFRKVVKIILSGEGLIDNITISTEDHMTHFIDGVEWLHENQDGETGGWPIFIERKLPGVSILKPGWNSAMAQGQALSTIARAYDYTKNEKYLKSIYNGLKPYTVLSKNNGVKAIFMNKYTWYEEYPTEPSSFVLNGFIYSLFGLYDTKSVLEKRKTFVAWWSEEDEKALKLSIELYEDGIKSLKEMLPLYDSGSRTFYDLRHLSLKIQPNIARWDYHTTHLSQLAMLSTIEDDPIFSEYYEYWFGYMHGKLAKHN